MAPEKGFMSGKTCSQCFEEFESYSRLKRHLKTAHKMINKKRGNNDQSSVEAASEFRGVIQLTFGPNNVP